MSVRSDIHPGYSRRSTPLIVRQAQGREEHVKGNVGWTQCSIAVLGSTTQTRSHHRQTLQQHDMAPCPLHKTCASPLRVVGPCDSQVTFVLTSCLGPIAHHTSSYKLN